MGTGDIIRGGREYHISPHFIYKYNLTKDALRRARKNGLPYILADRLARIGALRKRTTAKQKQKASDGNCS